MRQWVALVPLVALVVAGCMVNPSTQPTAGLEQGDETRTTGPTDDVATTPGAKPPDEAKPGSGDAAPPGAGAHGDMPPGAPRADLAWQAEYACIGPPGISCTPHRYWFEVEERYASITARVTLTAPGGALCCNGIQVRLVAPDQTAVPAGFAMGPHAAGETVTIEITDPMLLEKDGTWRLAVSTADVDLTFISYEARVSFAPHPEYIGPTSTTAPRAVQLHASWYMGAGGPVAWQRIADVLPEGFQPTGYPGDPVLDEPCCTPEGTFAGLIGILVDYEAAWIDDLRLPSGRMALALTAVRPSDTHDIGAMRNWAILAVAATDARLVDALQAWGFDASLGSINMDYQAPPGTMDVVSSHGNVESERLSFTVGVPAGQSVVLGTYGMNGPPQQIGQWGIRDREAGPALVYELPGHNQRGGPGILQGHFGGLGEVGPIGGIGSAATWFGAVGGSPGENEPGRLVYKVFAPDDGRA